MENTRSMREVFLRTVAIVGLIAVLVLGAWGIIIVASNLVNIFGGIGSKVTSLFNVPRVEQVVVAAPKNISSGESLLVSWNHKNGSGSYAYALSYSCAPGLSMKAPLPNGSTQTVVCEKEFNYTNADKSMTLTPTLSSGQSANVVVKVSAKKLSDNSVGAIGNATVVVAPKIAATPSTSVGNQGSTVTYVPAAPVATLYGYPDLAVRMIGVYPTGNRTSVQFEIQNVGTNVAHSGWSFTAQLPLNPVYTYQSQSQQALNPGDKIVYTLGFDAPYAGVYPYPQQYPYNNYNTCGYQTTYVYDGVYNYPSNSYNCNGNGNNYNYSNYGNRQVTVTVDAQNAVFESSEYNNTATISI